MAPTAPVKMAPKIPVPRLMPNLPKRQYPTKLPKIPTTILPNKPKLPPLKI